MHPVSVKGVLIVDGKVVLLRNERNEWEMPGGRMDSGEFGLHAVADLESIVLPAGYARSIKSWSQHAES